MRQDDDLAVQAARIVSGEGPAESGGDAERIHEAGRGHGDADAPRLLSAQGVGLVPHAPDVRPRSGEALEFDDFRTREPHTFQLKTAELGRDRHQRCRIRKGQRFQNRGVDDREDCGIGPDGDGHRRGRQRGLGGRSEQGADGPPECVHRCECYTL